MPNPEQVTEYVPRTIRAKELLSFAKEEVRLFDTGEIDRISDNEELSNRFGYQKGASFYYLLKRGGLLAERRRIKQVGGSLKQGQLTLAPSYETAWMIGVLSGGGNVNHINGAISVTESDRNFLDVIKSRGERLFGVESYEDTLRKTRDGQLYQHVHFYSRGITRQLGDLRRDTWPQSIQEKHPWITKDPRYITGLLEGVFDVRGLVHPYDAIIFLTSYPNVANFLAELLIRIGVDNPIIRYKEKERENVMGVGIYNLKDMKQLAQNIHSNIPRKEGMLEVIREKEPRKRGFKAKKFSDEEVVLDYFRARQALGHAPSSSEIIQLKRDGIIRCSNTVFIQRFGNGESFVIARTTLEKITQERGTEFFSG